VKLKRRYIRGPSDPAFPLSPPDIRKLQEQPRELGNPFHVSGKSVSLFDLFQGVKTAEAIIENTVKQRL
jgi:hypothetical protein